MVNPNIQVSFEYMANTTIAAMTHLPTYREMESDTDEDDHFLKDQTLLIDIDHVYAKVVEGIESLDSENLCGGRSIISDMDPADAGKYLDDRITTLTKINAVLIETIENLEDRECELHNTYKYLSG
jgi:hypothetical protein